LALNLTHGGARDDARGVRFVPPPLLVFVVAASAAFGCKVSSAIDLNRYYTVMARHATVTMNGAFLAW